MEQALVLTQRFVYLAILRQHIVVNDAESRCGLVFGKCVVANTGFRDKARRFDGNAQTQLPIPRELVRDPAMLGAIRGTSTHQKIP